MKASVKTKNFETECRVALTEWQKFKGLMLKKEIKPLLFVFDKEKRYAFHTFFMLDEIGIIFISKDKKIVEKKLIRPFKLFMKPKNKAKYVLEIPSNYLDKFKTGEKIKINFDSEYIQN